jgi:hypothetical protein
MMNSIMGAREDVTVETKNAREEMRKNRKAGSKKLKTINKVKKVTTKVMQKVTVKTCMEDRGRWGGASYEDWVVCGISEALAGYLGMGSSCL